MPIQPEGTPLQQVRVIAAFVNASGQIVPPPVTQVTFTLPQSSAFTGYAMNAGSSTSADFAFVPERARSHPEGVGALGSGQNLDTTAVRPAAR